MTALTPSDDKLLAELLKLPNQSPREGASAEMIALFEAKVGLTLPALFKALLLESNGGEWCFGRFEINPFVHPGIGDWSSEEVWEDLAEHSSLLGNPYVTEQKVLPFASDYGEGMYCFDYREKTDKPPIVFIPFGDQGEEIEEIADSFAAYVEESLSEEAKEASKKTFRIEVSIPKQMQYGVPVVIPELEKFGVIFEFVDNKVLADDEKKSSFCEDKTVAKYADPKRTVVFTMYDPQEFRAAYGVLQTHTELAPTEVELRSNGQDVADSGIRYLPGRVLGKAGMSSYCVWHLSRPEDLTPDCKIAITFSYLDE